MAASEVAVINNHEIIRDEYIMVPIDYLLYAPVNLMKGMSMNAVEYASKVKELEDAQKAIETAVAPLIHAYPVDAQGPNPCSPASVMAGLVPAIHVFEIALALDVNARHKAGNDGPRMWWAWAQTG
jgi:hypothetical protein